MRQALRLLTLTGLTLFCAIRAARAEPFVGQFELKTLQSAPRSFELQSQNAWSWGQPARQIAVGPDDLVLDENSVVRERYALELEMGFTSALKARVGVELERERLDEPESIDQANRLDDLRLSDVGAEMIFVLAPREGNGVGYGVVAEIEGLVDQEEPSDLTLGLIMELQSGRWFAAAVPMAVRAFGGEAEEGERIDNKWDFAYALQLTYALSQSWSLALEGYGTVERLGSSGQPSPSARMFGDFNQHRFGPVMYYVHDFGVRRRRAPQISGSELLADADAEGEGTSLTIGLGLLEGLNGNTADHTLKLSIEVDF